MRKLCLLFSLLVVFFACPDDSFAAPDESRLDKFGQAFPADSYDDPRITGVCEAEISHFSYHVLLESDVEPRHFCGGTIINEHFVLTAAHCLIYNGRVIDHILVTIHTDDTSKVGIFNRVRSNSPDLYIHPNYVIGDRSFLNDIALIKLSRPLRLGNNLHPAYLPPFNSQNEHISGKKAHLVGFGKRIWTGRTNRKLRAAALTILPDEVCLHMSKMTEPVKKYLYSKSHMLCAVTQRSCLGVACPGDSGCGLVIRENGRTTIHGISSFISYKHGVDPPTLNVEKPSYFTRVAHFVPWINATIKRALNNT